jgi:hypothetical protein
MKTKVNKKNPPDRHAGAENKPVRRENKLLRSSVNDFNFDLYEMLDNAGIENKGNDYFDLESDDYYYLEIEEG